MITVDYNILGIRDGEKVLDVGCGEGRHSFRACEETNCTVCALDIDRENLAKTKYMFHLMEADGKCRGRWFALRGDATRLPLKDAHFDRVICSEVLEHIPDDHEAVLELKRVLKDEGRLAVSVPTYFSETIYWKISRDYSHQPGGHVRKYRAREITALLEEHGFHVYATRHKHALHTFYWFLRCLFGINREKAVIPALYHRFLVWDIKTKAKPIRFLENLLNPLIAKSIVVYAEKNTGSSRDK
jgi:SAM-dependent methyltransferase